MPIEHLVLHDPEEVHYLSLSRITSKGWYLGYQNIGRYDDRLLSLKAGGCIYNPYFAYGWSESYVQDSIRLESGVSFDFLNSDPGYFKLYSLSSDPLYINSITIRFMGQVGPDSTK